MVRFKVQAPVVLIHVVGWIIFFSLPFLLFPRPFRNDNVTHFLISYNYWVYNIFYIVLFYFNGYFLIPRLYLKKKYFIYILIIIGLYIIGQFLRQPIHMEPQRFNHPAGFNNGMPFGDSGMFNGPPPPRDTGMFGLRPDRDPSMFNRQPPPGFNDPNHRSPFDVNPVAIFLFTMVWALSTASRITKQWNETEQRVARAEADKANAELSFLKAQINPHFLFNTLNNIYSLAVRQNEHTADSIMKLSNIMRYVTDEVNDDIVPLQDEIDCISDYIDLQRLRLSKKMFIDFTVTGNTAGKKIAPLILMTFVENVFKYGVSSHEFATISIKVFAEEKTISFYCQNRIFPVLKENNRKGIGIENTMQRLTHMYANRHLLNITNEGGLYTVELTLMM
jgi:hypothetical protein